MRLTKIKLAGFKSFADPTSVGFPSNLTGVVGPNGCGKSNIIDAVRWVMGELSAKHLRGDSMTDVIFNGSASRKPVGTASVELVFDNSDGKISGPYADYAEVSLKRQVTRDGTSNYFLNGARCRRKDITQLFLGTGLGSRSYAIIEQGMISRVIEAKADDMRAFVEEAAGISRYKERRKETEARISDTRENLERLQDVRDEVDKQIRHLQRQAATARRYQALKETERRLTAELLALRLREIDSRRRGAGQRGARVRAHHAAGARRPARRRSRHRDAARLPDRAVRAREQRAGPLLRSRRRDQPHRADPSRTRASCASSSATSSRRRAPRWPSSTRTSSATNARSQQLRAEIDAARRRSSRRRRPPKARCNEGARGRRAGARRLAAALGRFQPRAGRRAPDHAGGARAHRAARKPAAPAVGASPIAWPSSARR